MGSDQEKPYNKPYGVTVGFDESESEDLPRSFFSAQIQSRETEARRVEDQIIQEALGPILALDDVGMSGELVEEFMAKLFPNFKY